jgi:diguanylate cyclase (GGDEF)-like protein
MDPMRHDPSKSHPPHVAPVAWRLAGASLGYLVLSRMLEGVGMPPSAACWLGGLGVTAGMTLWHSGRLTGPASAGAKHARRFAQLARRSDDLNSLTTAILEAFRRATKADQLLLWLPPAGDASFHLTAGIGHSPDTLVIPEFSLRDWLEEGPMRARLVTKAAKRHPSVLDQLLISLGASACLPLVLHGRVIGLVTVGLASGRTLQAKDLKEVEALSAQAAMALAPYQLQEEQKLHLTKLEAVSRLYLDAQRKAVTDGLTGLITHAHFKEQLASRFFEARRFDQPLSLMFIDIDHFKRINDTYGHQTGDEVLRQVCRAIQERVRACDVAARYGGEEIAVLLPQTDLAGAMILAERMREAISDLSVTDLRGEALVSATASIGVSELEPDDQAPADLIERADQAVYRAKHRGRNQVVQWSPSLLV